MTNKNDDRESERKKLYGPKNKLKWADLTQVILEKKEVWDVIDRLRPKPTSATQTRKKDKDNAISSNIIK